MARSSLRLRFASLIAIGVLISSAQSGLAVDQPADIFKGKRLIIGVGSAAGSGYDLGARVLGRHFSRHLPGNPSIIIQNMPGGGGRTIATYLSSSAPRDGTFIAAVQSFIAVDPLFDSSKTVASFDPRQFTWLGSIASSTSVAVSWHTSPAKTYRDLFERELVVGGVGAGTPMVTFPYLFNRLLGMKFKVVAGYLASPDVDLAMERGEVQGRVDFSWHTLRATRLDWVKQGKMHMLFQLGLQKHAELEAIPLIYDLAKTEEDRSILKAAFMSYDFGRAFVAPPGLPENATQVLRSAFMETMVDKAFLADAETAQLEVNPVSAERLDALLKEVYNLPENILARAKALQNPTGAAEVEYRHIRASIVSRDPGDFFSIRRMDGAQEKIVIADRTSITVNRAKVTNEALHAGMICAISYLGNQTTAKSVECD